MKRLSVTSYTISAMVDDCGSFIFELRKVWPVDAMVFLVSTSSCLTATACSITAMTFLSQYHPLHVLV